MKKKIASILVCALCVLLGVTACGGGSDNSFTKDDGVELTIWIQSSNQPEYFMGWFKNAFETQNPGITLNFVAGNSLGASLATSLKSPDGPDMTATWGGSVLPTLVDSNLLLSLDDVIDEELESRMVNQALLNKIDGSSYGAPIFGFASVIYYNKTVFDANGWEEPQTYEEFADLCAKIKAADYETIVTGYSYHIPQTLHARTMTEAELEHLIADDLTSSPLTGEGWENGWSMLADMYSKGFFAENISGYTTTTARSAFENQNALMIWTPSIDLITLSANTTFEIGTIVFPDAPAAYKAENSAYDTVSPITGVYTDVMCINANTEYPEECKKVIEFMYSDAAQQELLNCFMFPVLTGVSTDHIADEVKSAFDSAMKEVYDLIGEKGMSLYYMTYYKYESGLDSQLEQRFKEICK